MIVAYLHTPLFLRLGSNQEINGLALLLQKFNKVLVIPLYSVIVSSNNCRLKVKPEFSPSSTAYKLCDCEQVT